jgi:phage tail sheath protein FI
VTFISPPSASVVNQSGNESSNITSWLASLSRSSSYVVADSGWKYQYDKYNNVYRWIPLNGDIAGLCVYTDSIKDPWFSPAGFNRGAIKNAIKLAWNPTKTYRDTLYAAGVNPVVTFPGQGTVLFGDKTLQSKPSAFDRINVRRLFITLEKSIAKAAQYSLFELNDEFTRAQFISLVTPFLRDIQGRRGITDFKVVCDSTNNTSNVIDSNQFVGDIYIKPARSVNFIQLNFVAVGTGVDFNTIVGVA